MGDQDGRWVKVMPEDVLELRALGSACPVAARLLSRYIETRPGRGGNGAPTVSAKTRAFVLERDDYRCVFCGSGENLTIDHKIALDVGGKNSRSNMQTACGRCNNSKGNGHKPNPHDYWRSETIDRVRGIEFGWLIPPDDDPGPPKPYLKLSKRSKRMGFAGPIQLRHIFDEIIQGLTHADVVELVDTAGPNPAAERLPGSTPGVGIGATHG